MNDLGAFIRELRKKFKCNQEEFARIMGVTPTTVSRWENDKATPIREKWELLHDIDEMLGKEFSLDKMKIRLLVASCVGAENSPLESYKRGELDRELKEALDRENFFEEFCLKERLDTDSLIQKKIDYWLRLAEEEQIELPRRKEWRKLMRYVVPLFRHAGFITGVEFMPDKSRGRFAKILFWKDFNYSIEEKPVRRLFSYGKRMEGYALLAGELALCYQELFSDTKETVDYDPDRTLERLEDWWGKVSDFEGDETLDQVLNKVPALAARLLEPIELKYCPHLFESYLQAEE